MYFLAAVLLGITGYGAYQHLPEPTRYALAEFAVDVAAKARIAARRLCPRGHGADVLVVSNWTDGDKHYAYAVYTMYDDDYAAPSYGIVYEVGNEQSFEDTVAANVAAFMRRDQCTGLANKTGVAVITAADGDACKQTAQIQPLLAALAGPTGDYQDNKTATLRQVVQAATGVTRAEIDAIGDDNRCWLFFGTKGSWTTTDESVLLVDTLSKINDGLTRAG
jgi:hypothetical protein